MILPLHFIQTIQKVFGKEGEAFIENIPQLIKDASTRWGLTDIQPVPNLSYNFVAFAKKGDEEVILKMGVPNSEQASEMAALRLFNGEGACQLLDCDEERGAFLLERLNPGIMLAELKDDDERTHIAIDVMRNLIFRRGGVTPPLQNKFIQLSAWFDDLKTVRSKFDGGTGPFPKEIFERVESFLPELFADENVNLIHGDFHHFNILKSERGWLAIDPKGVIGPLGYEVGPLMINPWGSLSDGTSLRVQTKRRMDIFRERLGWEREKIIQWSVAHAVLSAWWDFQDDMDWKYSLNCAKVFSEM